MLNQSYRIIIRFQTHFLSLSQSHRYSPTNIDVLSWLGAYYMDSQYCDKAVQYFECATLIQWESVHQTKFVNLTMYESKIVALMLQNQL